jgi:hypothetical protein
MNTCRECGNPTEHEELCGRCLSEEANWPVVPDRSADRRTGR